MAPVQSPPDDGLGSTVPSSSERAEHWTRGPWVAVPDGRAREECAWLIEERSTPCNFIVATVVTDIGMLRDKGEATARLIAAAPDLYEALKGLADAYVALLLMKAEDPSRFREPGSPYANALAALTRAALGAST